MKLMRYSHRLPRYPRFCLLYAEKDARPVLRERHAWRKVNGVMMRTACASYVFVFRRYR